MWSKVEVEKKKRNIRKKIEGRNGNKKKVATPAAINVSVKCGRRIEKGLKKKDIEQSKNPVLNSVKRRAATNNNQKKKRTTVEKRRTPLSKKKKMAVHWKKKATVN